MSDRVRGAKIGGGTVEGIIARIDGPTTGIVGRPPLVIVRDDGGTDWACSSYEYVDQKTAPNIVAPATTPAPRLLPSDSAARKRYPMASGLLDYFPDALAEVSYVSWVGNEKHNPGEPLHHARGKSMDHADCCMRHLEERGGFDTVVDKNGNEYQVRHSAALAWRALALCQEEIEKEKGLPLPRGARA